MTLDKIVFVDTETTGLDPEFDPIWEVAAVRQVDGVWQQRNWFLPIDVGRVSQWVIDNTGFAERYDLAHLTALDVFCREFLDFVGGAHMAGNVVSFDAQRLERIFRACDMPVPWHYHLIDVEAVAVGVLAARGTTVELPWNSEHLSELLNVPIPEGRHAAMVDAVWARDVFCAAARAGAVES